MNKRRSSSNSRLIALVGLVIGGLVIAGRAWGDVGNMGPWGDQGDETYKNPVLPGDYSDIDVIRVGSDYYMFSSTFQFSPGVIVLKSQDLVNWTIIGHAVSDLTKMNPKYSYKTMNSYGYGVWAGSIRYHNHKFWIYWGTFDDGYFMTTATDPAGPWQPVVRVAEDSNPNYPGPGWDDPCVYWDENGQEYFVGTEAANGTRIHLWKVAPDGKTLLSSTRVIVSRGRIGEANKIYKIGDYFYLMHSEFNGATREVYMLRAKNIWGDGGSPGHVGTYEKKKVEESTTGAREPNQGGLVQTESGSWWFLTQQGQTSIPGVEGRPAVLLPASIVNGWPVLGVDTNNNGAGEMVWKAKKPINGFPKITPQASDEFSSGDLQPQWEWNYQPRADMWSLTERPGYMRLRAFKPLQTDNLLKAGNTLTQRFMRGDSGVAIVKIEIGNMADGQQAGLSHFGGGRAYSLIGVAQSNGTRAFRYKNTTTGSTVNGPTIPNGTTTIWLKSVMNSTQNTAFQYSVDGTTFTTLGGPYNLVGADYRGDRIGIYSFNNSGEGGYIDVDWFHYTYAGQAESVGLDADAGGASGAGGRSVAGGTSGSGGATSGGTGGASGSGGGRAGAGGKAGATTGSGGAGGESAVGGAGASRARPRQTGNPILQDYRRQRRSRPVFEALRAGTLLTNVVWRKFEQ